MEIHLQKFNPFKNNYVACLAVAIWVTVVNLLIVAIPKIWALINSIRHHTLIIGVYFLLLVLAILLQGLFKHRITGMILRIIGFPIGLLWELIILNRPVLGIQGSIIVYLIISFSIPFYLLKLCQFLHITQFRSDKIFGLTVTITCLIAVIFSNQIKRLAYSLPPLGSYTPKKKDGIKLKEAIDYALTPPIIRLFIYISYIIFYVIFNIYDINTIYNEALKFSFGIFVLLDFFLSEFFKYNKAIDFKFTELFRKIVSVVTASIPTLDEEH